jgi:hypothetical protein
MLYAAIKTGVSVKLEDMGLNVLFDLLSYSAEIDSAVIDGINGKSIRKYAPMDIAEMTVKGKMRR